MIFFTNHNRKTMMKIKTPRNAHCANHFNAYQACSSFHFRKILTEIISQTCSDPQEQKLFLFKYNTKLQMVIVFISENCTTLPSKEVTAITSI